MNIPVRETFEQRAKRVKAEEAALASIFPDFSEQTERMCEALQHALDSIERQYADTRRRIVASPYERLMLAASLVDMTTEDAATLANECDGRTFDDVMFCIDGLRAKVEALRAKAATAEVAP